MPNSCQHSAYRFILLDQTRSCSCVACGHQFQVHLGGGNKYGQAITDDIPNDMPGITFAAAQTGGLRWT